MDPIREICVILRTSTHWTQHQLYCCGAAGFAGGVSRGPMPPFSAGGLAGGAGWGGGAAFGAGFAGAFFGDDGMLQVLVMPSISFRARNRVYVFN
jgi:hypothetical protein